MSHELSVRYVLNLWSCTMVAVALERLEFPTGAIEFDWFRSTLVKGPNDGPVD